MFQTSLILRIWEISRFLASTTLLTLVRALSGRAGNDHEQFRVAIEGVSRALNLTSHISQFSLVFLSGSAPQLLMDVAVYVAQVGIAVHLLCVLSTFDQSCNALLILRLPLK